MAKLPFSGFSQSIELLLPDISSKFWFKQTPIKFFYRLDISFINDTHTPLSQQFRRSTSLSHMRAAWLLCHIMDCVLDILFMENSVLTFTWLLFVYLTCIYYATMYMLLAMLWGYMMNKTYLLPLPGEYQSLVWRRGSCQILMQVLNVIAWSPLFLPIKK